MEEQGVAESTPIEVDQTGDTSMDELVPQIETPMPREEGSLTEPVTEGPSTESVRPTRTRRKPRYLEDFVTE